MLTYTELGIRQDWHEYIKKHFLIKYIKYNTKYWHDIIHFSHFLASKWIGFVC